MVTTGVTFPVSVSLLRKENINVSDIRILLRRRKYEILSRSHECENEKSVVSKYWQKVVH